MALFDKCHVVSQCPLPRHCGRVPLSREPQQQTATQVGYLATVQEALSGNRWGSRRRGRLCSRRALMGVRVATRTQLRVKLKPLFPFYHARTSPQNE